MEFEEFASSGIQINSQEKYLETKTSLRCNCCYWDYSNLIKSVFGSSILNFPSNSLIERLETGPWLSMNRSSSIFVSASHKQYARNFFFETITPNNLYPNGNKPAFSSRIIFEINKWTLSDLDSFSH